MKTRFLLPRAFNKIGWVLFIPALLIVIIMSVGNLEIDNHFEVDVFAVADNGFLSETSTFSIIKNGISDEILLVMIILGGLFVGFSKQKNEDEFTAQVRYESLVWAVYVNSAVMLFATIFIYGTYYLNVMMANLFTLLFFFVFRFHLKLFKLNKAMSDEE